MVCRSKLAAFRPGLACIFVGLAFGCAKVAPMSTPGAGGATAGITGGAGRAGGATGTAGATGSAGSVGTITGAAGTTGGGADAGSDAACMPSVSCTPTGGRYCGKIGNGCPGGSIECGACPGDNVCMAGLCVGGTSCARLTCASGGATRYCGTIGDGCGM
jgi:hypothetical protein